ncbi:MAG: hypothetical protein IT445_00270 [Phycisphaeraceae bacterium]|nr:hypothetical protein [Phycisphaeraceae bacterium]
MSQNQPQNPFIHSHDHGHGHHHHDHDDHASIDALDPAQQSLSDALRVSFMILKVIMACLLIAYCFTGIFRVEANQVAVRLQFGRIIGDGGGQVYGTGWHFGWPYPIEQKIYLPTNLQNLAIDRSFWFDLNPADAGKTVEELAANYSSRELDPERDGFLITGDANIIHARFKVTYRISDPVAFITNVGEADARDPMFAGQPYNSLAGAEQLVRAAVQEAVIFAVAQTTADDVLKKKAVDNLAIAYAQQVLDAQQSGITIPIEGGITIDDPTMPMSVRPAYYAVINAESERAQKVNDAEKERTTTLNAAAGEANQELFKLIQTYEYHHIAGETQAAADIEQVLDRAFDSFQIQGKSIGGNAARIINEARAYKTQVVEQIRSEARSFTSLLDLYRQNPALVRARLWQQAKKEIFTGDVETFYADGKLYLVTNRDPNVRREREKKELERATKPSQ